MFIPSMLISGANEIVHCKSIMKKQRFITSIKFNVYYPQPLHCGMVLIAYGFGKLKSQ